MKCELIDQSKWYQQRTGMLYKEYMLSKRNMHKNHRKGRALRNAAIFYPTYLTLYSETSSVLSNFLLAYWYDVKEQRHHLCSTEV